MIRKKESIQDIVNAGLAGRENLNCAETILFAANQAYQLKLPPEALKLSAAFGAFLLLVASRMLYRAFA